MYLISHLEKWYVSRTHRFRFLFSVTVVLLHGMCVCNCVYLGWPKKKFLCSTPKLRFCVCMLFSVASTFFFHSLSRYYHIFNECVGVSIEKNGFFHTCNIRIHILVGTWARVRWQWLHKCNIAYKNGFEIARMCAHYWSCVSLWQRKSANHLSMWKMPYLRRHKPIRQKTNTQWRRQWRKDNDNERTS